MTELGGDRAEAVLGEAANRRAIARNASSAGALLVTSHGDRRSLGIRRIATR
ncbi:hypothetical protein ACSNOI_03885 [Actinomadura kijaniata]|uniref:hypothetical protein n=1 Tax=Actinomadura kijaniata TaxID=46161 RepID=UPI003F1CA6A0